MTIAQSVNDFLSQQQISFDTVQHPPSHSSVQSAIAAQVPLSNIAKAVILKDSIDNYLMAVIPASKPGAGPQDQRTDGHCGQAGLRAGSKQSIPGLPERRHPPHRPGL